MAAPSAAARWRPATVGGALVCAALFVYSFVQTAWIVDDAYITFRTVDNFLHGYGLTWNTGERVQAYTHPLWMLCTSAVVALTHEYFYTSLALSFVCSAATVLIGCRWLAQRGASRAYAFIALVVTSKAVMDYSSSGLENPLSYLLLLLFYTAYFAPPPAGDAPRPFGRFLLIASLAYLNRQDTLLLYLPALAEIVWREWPAGWLRSVRTVVIGTVPATMWLLFSVFYYGFPFPNTAYAKLTDTALPFSQRLQHGITYLGFSLRWDALGVVALAAAVTLAARRRQLTRVAALAGACLYLVYVLIAGAGATHMLGRFVAAPLLLVFLAAADLMDWGEGTWTPMPVLLVAAYVLANPVSPLKQRTAWYLTPAAAAGGYIDTVWFAHKEGTGLFTYGKVPNVCLEDGVHFRDSPDPLRVGGCGGTDPIGFFGFGAGPRKWVIDRLALSDAFLARLRPCVDFRGTNWKPGHYPREIPEGYVESVLNGTDALQDPGLQAYYAALATVTRGPLWSAHRLQVLVLLNAGRYDSLLSDYNRSVVIRARTNRCQF